MALFGFLKRKKKKKAKKVGMAAGTTTTKNLKKNYSRNTTTSKKRYSNDDEYLYDDDDYIATSIIANSLFDTDKDERNTYSSSSISSHDNDYTPSVEQSTGFNDSSYDDSDW